MPSFHYTNPYTQPPPPPSPICVVESLKQLLQAHRTSHKPPSIATIRPIWEKILVRSDTIEWTVEVAKGMALLVVTLLDPFMSSGPLLNQVQPIPEASLATFSLLASAMEEWSGELMYKVLLLECSSENSGHGRKNVLDILFHFAISSGDGLSPVHQIAIVALGAAYRSMERLHQYLTLDPYRPDTSSWWLKSILDDEKSLHKLTFLATTILLNSSESTRDSSQSKATSIFPTSEQVQLGAMSCLCTILKRDPLTSLDALVMEANDVRELCGFLLGRLQALINPQLATKRSRWRLPCALMSVVLLSFIQWRHDIDLSEFDRIVHSTTLVDDVTTFVFSSLTGTGNNHQKRDSATWTVDEENVGARIYGLDVLSSWALSGVTAWSVFIDNKSNWERFVGAFWNNALTNGTENMAPQITHIVWLQHSCRLISREALFAILQRLSSMDEGPDMTANTNLLTPLFELFQSPNLAVQMQAVCLVRLLMSDRRTLNTHDDVSRAFWSWIDDDLSKQVIQMVIHLSKNQEAIHPLLLVLLDLLDVILQDQAHCDIALKDLSAESLELLLTLVEPKKVKFDYKDSSDWDDLSLDIASETPPVNNLSRMDENSICIEQEIGCCSKGLENTVQLATATAMARLGYSCSSSNEEGIHLLKSRICKAVNNFISHFLSDGSQEPSGHVSFDTNKRSLRLQVAVAGSGNEDFVATALFSNQLLNEKRLSRVSTEMDRARLELRSAEKHLRDLEGQNMRLVYQRHSQSIIFQREMSRIKENTSQDAKQLVVIHATERTRAEDRVMVCMQRIDEAESELQNARLEAEESQRSVILTKKELHIALTKATDLENEKVILARQVDEKKAMAKVLQEEMHSQTQKLASLFRSRQELEDELHERNQAVKQCDITNETLRDNLEELFADMVSLTTIYESKEDEVSHLSRNHFDEAEAAGRKLRREEERNKELTVSVDQLRHDNDKLYKKLAKYKERLEEERRERQEEAIRRKRNGPVSYINQLHNATTSDRSARDQSTSRKESGSNKSRLRANKENSYSIGSHN